MIIEEANLLASEATLSSKDIRPRHQSKKAAVAPARRRRPAGADSPANQEEAIKAQSDPTSKKKVQCRQIRCLATSALRGGMFRRAQSK